MSMFGFCIDSVWFCIDITSIRFGANDELIQVHDLVTGVQIDSAARLLGLKLSALEKALDRSAGDWELKFDDERVAVREDCFKQLAINAFVK